MHITRLQQLYSKPLDPVKWFTFVFLIFFTGCTFGVPSVAEPPEAISTESPSTPPDEPKPTSLTEAGSMENTPHVSPYIPVNVLSVEVQSLDTTPVEVELVIRGTLPDQCKYQFYSVENRVEQSVNVSLRGIHPSDSSCPQEDQTIEYVLPLGRDMPEAERGFSPGDYRLTVNNYQTSFSIK